MLLMRCGDCFIIKNSRLALVFAFSTAMANPLANERDLVIKTHVKLLGEGDYKIIPTLFAKDAVAVSSSGIVDNPEHFYRALCTKTITNPKSKLTNIFSGKLDSNMMTVLFDYSWRTENGKDVSAKFLDLIVFKDKSDKISKLFVFSNAFKQDIMKKLADS